MRNRHIHLVAIAVCFALSASAVAFPTSNQLHVPSVADDDGDLPAHDDGDVHNVMWMDTPKDPRDYISKKMRTDEAVKAFAITKDELALIKKTFGNLICKFEGMNEYAGNSADLGAALDEIVVPLHAFKKRDMSTCYFLTYERQKIKVVISEEDKRKYAAWVEGGYDMSNDRIALKLVKPIDGLSQEELFPFADPAFKLQKSMKGLVVSGYQDDWNKKRGVIASKMPEPLAYVCEIKNSRERDTIAATNCASDAGASGAKMLVRGGNGKLTKVAMMTKMMNTAHEGATHRDGTPYNEKSMFTVVLLVDSEFAGAEPLPKQAQSLAEKCTNSAKSNASAQKQTALGQQTTSAICSRALNCNLTAFDYSGAYNAEIEEARRRGFNVAKCKAVVSIN